MKTISIQSKSHLWNFIRSNYICEISSVSMLVNRARTNFFLLLLLFFIFIFFLFGMEIMSFDGLHIDAGHYLN